MEQELFEGLHKNRRWALEAVCQENLCRSWYLSYQLAGDAAGAASLLLSAWREALAALKNAKEAPGEDFQGLLSEKILAQYQQGVQPDTRFENLPPPKVGKSYQYLVGEVKRLPAPCIGCMPTAAWTPPSWLPSPGRTARPWPSASPKGRSSWPSAAPPGPSPSGRPMCAFPPSSGTRAAMASKRHGCPCLCCMSSGRSWACLSSPPRSGPESPGPPSASRFWA